VFEADESGAKVHGFASGREDGRSFRVEYSLRYDPGWEFRGARVLADIDWEPRLLRVDRSAEGLWSVDGERTEQYDPCEDVALSFTPAAHTAAIRRMMPGSATTWERLSLWLPVPSFQVRAVSQSHTRFDEERYRGELDGEPADLIFDAEGVVRQLSDVFVSTY
jgi:hypothetical protein